MATAAHPRPDELSAFAQGRLSADESATIEEHLQSCDTCAGSLERQPEDSLLRIARGAGTVTEGAAFPPQPTTAEAATEVGEVPPPVPPELSGQGRYRIVRLIGQGGMGAVYEAEHGVMRRTVALKVIKRAYIADAPAVERFRRETRAAARLHHPNIVTAFDAESCGDTHFLVMEYVPGKTLAHVLKERGPLPIAEACDYVRQAALGLQHAHEMGMVHRDVKPDNVMLAASPAASARGVVKVLDFGLASLALEDDGSNLTEANVIMGTPAYMAPEQSTDAHAADIRADIYSLGCTLYHLLTGEVPYPAPTSLLKILAHREQPVPQVRRKRPEVPEGLAAVLARMLAKKPDERYQTPGEVAAALEPFTNPRPVESFDTIAEPVGGELPRRPRHRRLVAALAALLLIGVTIAGAVVYRIQTDKGELVITSESDDVKVVIKQGGKVVEVIDTKTDKQITLKLKSGEYELELQGAPEGLKLTVDKVKLTRGETELAKIERAVNRNGERQDYTNTIGMKFKLIPAGSFMMGSSPEEIAAALKLVEARFQKSILSEGREHPVEITQPFYMGTTEVTVEQFRQFVEANPKYNVGDERWKEPGFEQFDDCPVVWVSWQNAVDFCNWLSVKEGKQYRLPTEAEWEYSCRAGKAGTRYCFGDDAAQLENYCWYNKYNRNWGRTNPVGQKKPNDWGLYDMHGNAWEWCQDNYDPNYYRNSPPKDPPGGAGGERP